MKAIADAGCTVIVAGGKVGELYLHYCNKYNILVVRLLSKFDLRRLCKAIKATPLPRIVSGCVFCNDFAIIEFYTITQNCKWLCFCNGFCCYLTVLLSCLWVIFHLFSTVDKKQLVTVVNGLKT